MSECLFFLKKNKNLMKQLFYICCLTFFFGCSSPQDSLQKRDFDRAYKTALRQLEKGKSTNKNAAILTDALEGILARDLREKENLIQTNQLEKLEKAIDINQNLQKKIDKAITFLDDSFLEDLKNLRAEETELSEVVAKTYFEDGKIKFEDAVANNDKTLSRDAYNDLLKARNYGFDEQFVNSLLEESRVFSTLRYMVEGNISFDIQYNWEIDRVLDNLEDINNPFTEVYYEKTLNPKDIDCTIEINFESLDIDTQERDRERDFKEEVVVGKEKITNDKGEEVEVDKVEEVEGIVTEKTIIKTAEWRVTIDVRSHSSNCKIQSTRFAEALSSEISFYVLSGDERAIPRKYKKKNRDELMNDDDMVEALLEKIYDKVADYIFD